MASRTGAEGGLGLLGRELGPRVWTAWARAWSWSASVVLGMASRTGPRAAWACSGVGPRVWTAWARAWSWSGSVVWRMASRTGPRAAWACSGVGPRVWTAWARAWSW